MRVKVHPHRSKVTSGVEACVSVTEDMKGGRAYYMGTVWLKDAEFRIHQSGVRKARETKQRNVHAWVVGWLLGEEKIQRPVDVKNMRQVTYHYEIGRFITTDDGTDVTDRKFKAAVICGRDFYVSEF